MMRVRTGGSETSGTGAGAAAGPGGGFETGGAGLTGSSGTGAIVRGTGAFFGGAGKAGATLGGTAVGAAGAAGAGLDGTAVGAAGTAGGGLDGTAVGAAGAAGAALDGTAVGAAGAALDGTAVGAAGTAGIALGGASIGPVSTEAGRTGSGFGSPVPADPGLGTLSWAGCDASGRNGGASAMSKTTRSPMRVLLTIAFLTTVSSTPPCIARNARTLRGIGGKTPREGASAKRIVRRSPSRVTVWARPGAFSTTRPKYG